MSEDSANSTHRVRVKYDRRNYRKHDDRNRVDSHQTGFFPRAEFLQLVKE